ncbi:MAG: uracil-DNA glycosylase family protein [Alphaproteobacteria bacterium]|nr:uracil-DNA glycosylase family protein [Alphaproteobacteria bacterium]
MTRTKKRSPHPRDSLGGDQGAAPDLERLLAEVRACRLCAAHLPLGPRPVLRASRTARIVIAGQAPGTKVHESGVPWGDASGDRLRDWLGLDRTAFYDERRIAVIPQGFCYPGRGTHGDLPPCPECAATWHGPLYQAMPQVELFILAGQYALAYHLGSRRKATLTETVKAWREYRPRYFVLPHPSWHNNRWLKVNPWFGRDLVPELRAVVARLT